MPQPEVPSGEPPTAAAKPSVPHPAILGDAKVTINAPAFAVFVALTEPERLAAWWGEDIRVEAEQGGRYEATLPQGRLEGTITAIDGPQTLAFTWPIPFEGVSVVTGVRYTLTPRGPQTIVHLAHRAAKPMPGDWSALWRGVLEALKAHLEGEPPG